MANPITEIYKQYSHIVKKLPRTSMLHIVQDQLTGFQQCIEKGFCPDKLPNNKVNNKQEFYSWNAWKRASLQLDQHSSWPRSKLTEEAAKRYIEIAAKYLSQLQGKSENQ